MEHKVVSDYSNVELGENSNVKVYVRLRPPEEPMPKGMFEGGKDAKGKITIEVSGGSSVGPLPSLTIHPNFFHSRTQGMLHTARMRFGLTMSFGPKTTNPRCLRR